MAFFGGERLNKNTPDNFWARVRCLGRPDGCHEWTGGSRDHRGYGNLRWNGRSSLAHRVAWELTNGPIPDGMCVLHRCDNPKCCNTEHLFLGSRADNNADMYRKGRNVVRAGSAHGNAVLTGEDIERIRRAAHHGESLPALAAAMGISKSAVYRAAAGRTYRPGPRGVLP